MYIREIDDDFEYTVTRNNEIPPRLFEGCTKLAHISIPNSVNSIGSYAFDGTKWLTNQPDGVVYIGQVLYLYKGDMPANTSIAVNEGTIGIACSAFKDCSNLTSITIPNSVTNIGGFNRYPKVDYNDVFQGCNGLTTIISEIQNPFDLGSTFSYVDSSVFSNATLYVPKGTVSVYQSKEGWNKFQKIVESSGGSSSTDVVVENNVVYEIEGVTVAVVHADDVSGDVTIEASVEINGKTYEVTIIAKEAFKDCTQMTSAELPNSVTTIGEKAFDGCTSLRVIKIGRGVLEIARRAFANIFTSAGTRGEDDGLHFYCEAESVPNTSPEAFEGTDIAHATLHVPDNLVDTYKNSAPWSGFGTIVGLSETGILSIVVDISDIQIFDIQGNKLEKPRKGLNIIRTKDGKVKKVLMK